MNEKSKKSSETSIDYSLLPELLGYQLRLTQLAVFKDFSESVDDAQITPSLFAVLVVINANKDLKQTELAKAVRLDRSSVVSVIDKLEKRNLVIRKRVEGDRRTNALELTKQGRALLSQLTRRVKVHEQRLTENLTEREQATLIKLLGKILPDAR
ncbi:MAG: MarR family transcriptional regulator [Sedimenticola sp.]|uniref:MarR family transcriptional regulator n=1 Tax=Sedimenticola thiotaurini TaxID=1543721 RepID=A0A558D7C1_9GAMM|nr:MarR family transcriptional regulator [Sedimenticola sp.]TVT56922.1 MAG: MarR family transcriptional regulator [Sedimenticola thiotaurini]MCW8920909.1 MarR family transcriptional regulator [Sedimenticola sp.]MCW8946468.1 MarR family transcriptional regulator [Sedimenticola sp.]MCW8975115.1 MarR family transcriptional regulator [Sedimenticola sp.]